MDKTKRSLEEVLEAIKGSRGIKTLIAARLDVTRQTVDSYLGRWVTAQNAYDVENGVSLDLAESIVIKNLEIQQERQERDNVEVDTSDAKWLLTMKGASRGYTSKQQVEHSGPEGGPILIQVDK